MNSAVCEWIDGPRVCHDWNDLRSMFHPTNNQSMLMCDGTVCTPCLLVRDFSGVLSVGVAEGVHDQLDCALEDRGDIGERYMVEWLARV